MKVGTVPPLRKTGRWLVERLDRILAWAMPGHCGFCLAGSSGDRPWCEQCLAGLPWHDSACPLCSEPRSALIPADIPCGHCLKRRPNFDDSWVPFLYEGEMAQLIQRFKFNADRRAGQILLQLLLHAFKTRHGPGHVQAIVTADLHPVRARARGFDQTLWLGRQMARALELPLYRATRLRLTPTQRGLSRSARQRNVHRVYRVASALPGRVLLLDDVMTTGATLEALSRACRAQGARHVTACAIARTPAGRAI